MPDKVRELIEHELALIAELRLRAVFPHRLGPGRASPAAQDILCQGRGSAANSAVCYCLGITAVDPDAASTCCSSGSSRAERDEPPDIDVDFEHERREEVLQYIYEKYGRERAGMTAEVITYRGRVGRSATSARRWACRSTRVDALAKHDLGLAATSASPTQRLREAGLDPGDRTLAPTLSTWRGELIGFPRHLSQHVGGLVITRGPLCELVPIENAAMEDRTVIEWDKDDLDALGILKVDCLALGMLTASARASTSSSGITAARSTLATIPPEDPAVYDMICRADTIGVFQIESRAQMSMLPRLQAAQASTTW